MPEMTPAEAAEHVARITGARAALILSDAFTAGWEATLAWYSERDGADAAMIIVARDVLRQHHAALSANAGSEAKR